MNLTSRTARSFLNNASALVLAGLLGSGVIIDRAAADPLAASSGDGLSDWLNQKTMTGDWFGLRPYLEGEGIKLRAGYIGEGGNNLTGGIRSGTRYAQQIAFGGDFDFNKLFGWANSFGHLTLADRMGRDLRQQIGSQFEQEEIYGQGQNFRLSELSLDRGFWDNTVNLKAGYYPFGNEFGFSPIYLNFVNNALCAHMLLLPNDSGWLDGPRANWTGRIKLAPTPNFYAMTAISPVNPRLTQPGNGFNLEDSKGTTGAVIPLELGWIHGLAGDDLPGDIKIGGYYDTTHGHQDLAFSKIETTQRYGEYVLVDQTLYREHPGSMRGLTGFLGASMGDHTTGKYRAYYQGGFVYQGTFTDRDADTVGLGLVRALVNDRFLNTKEINGQILENYEGLIELNYGAQLTPWFLLRPSLQYAINPGAFTATPASQKWGDAEVFVLQAKITL